MSVGLYMNVQVPRAITEGLRLRGADVLTAQEDGAARLPDADLLDRASAVARVLFSQDSDLLREAMRRQRTGQEFAGLVYAHPLRATIGQCVRDLALIAQSAEPQDLRNRVGFLPLR